MVGHGALVTQASAVADCSAKQPDVDAMVDPRHEASLLARTGLHQPHSMLVYTATMY